MFKADIFSESKPLFTKVEGIVESEITSFLNKHYSKKGEWVGYVYQSGAIELNSNNFLIELGVAKYVLKRGQLGTVEVQESISLQTALVNQLFTNGFRVPEIIKNDDDNLFSTDSKHFWCLMPYVEGEYFLGKDNELENAGIEMVNLFSMLNSMSINFDRIQKVYPISTNVDDLISNLNQNIDKWPSIFGDNHAALISSHWEEIQDTLYKILEIQGKLVNTITLVHYDLHPHNLLMREKKVAAVLDFGSIVRAAAGVAFSFNLFKLSRQAIVFRKGDFSETSFLKQKNKIIEKAIAARLIAASDNLALLAKAEILRRTLLILQLNYEDNNSNWNHVLPIHLNALKEADIVYS